MNAEQELESIKRDQERRERVESAERVVVSTVTLMPGRAAAAIELTAEEIAVVAEAIIDANDVYEKDAEEGRPKSEERRHARHRALVKVMAAERGLMNASLNQ